MVRSPTGLPVGQGQPVQGRLEAVVVLSCHVERLVDDHSGHQLTLSGGAKAHFSSVRCVTLFVDYPHHE